MYNIHKQVPNIYLDHIVRDQKARLIPEPLFTNPQSLRKYWSCKDQTEMETHTTKKKTTSQIAPFFSAQYTFQIAQQNTNFSAVQQFFFFALWNSDLPLNISCI